MPGAYSDQQEPLLARESLFRQKLNQLRRSGEITRTTISSYQSRFKDIEQTNYLSNLYSSFENTDPRQLETLSLLDSLTELYNHNSLCRILCNEFKRAKRYQNDLTVLAMAIDPLTDISKQTDGFVFDSMLKEVAQFLMRTVRDVDIPARYDLERMIIVCPQTNLDGGLCLAGRLCNGIQSEHLSAISKKLSITISLGIATYPSVAQNDEQLISLALQSLTLAQQSGGNTFKISY